MEYFQLSIILCFSLVLILWIWRRRRRFSVFKNLGIPGPEPNFLMGNFGDFIRKKDDCLIEYFEKYGKVFGCFIGAKPLLVIADPDLIKIVQVREFKSFPHRDGVLPDAGVPNPDFLVGVALIKEFEEWKKTRAIISPCFSSTKLRKIVPAINDSVNRFLKDIAEKDNGNFDIAPMYKHVTFNISCKIELGIDTGIKHPAINLFVESATHQFYTEKTNILAAISLCFPELEPIPTMSRLIVEKFKYHLGLKSVNIVFNSVKEVISRRRICDKKTEDILQSMIDAKIDVAKLASVQDNELATPYEEQPHGEDQAPKSSEKKEYASLSDQSITGNALHLLSAGYESTSTALQFATYYLTEHQDIQDKVREEINANIEEGMEIQYEDISKLSYLDQVISETLRLHPFNILATNRVANQTFKYNGLIIPEGMVVAIPFYLLHRLPDYWPEPEKFNPDRFSPENKAKIDPAIYQPFGNGPRFCIGMKLAKLMMKLTLARLLKSYKLVKGKEQYMEIKYNVYFSRPKWLILRAIPLYSKWEYNS